jgi:hypothetical protein
MTGKITGLILHSEIPLRLCYPGDMPRMAIILLITLAIWFPVGAFVGTFYTPLPRPPGSFSFVAIEKHAEGEFMFVIRFDRHSKLADTPEQPTRSPLLLFENDRPLGPAHSTIGDIKNLGRGRYLHLPTVVYFSSSDNTDPRSNGRLYSWLMAAPEQPRR